jgi:hypothetical protein
MDGIYRIDKYKFEYIREIMGVLGMSNIDNNRFCWYGHDYGNRMTA